MRKHNLHTHTNYSDGKLSPEQLVENARLEGLEIIGISDHAFSSKLPPLYQITENLQTYLTHLRKIQQAIQGIEVKVGIEIDVSMFYGTNPSALPFNMLNKFDYILFEYVNTEHEYWGTVGNRDISHVFAVRDKLTVPVGLAHNDLQQNFDGKEEQIARLLADYDIFVEFNKSEYHPGRGVGRNTRNGLDYYEHLSPKLLESLSKQTVGVVIGTDSHTGENLANLNDIHQFIEKNHLSYHRIIR